MKNFIDEKELRGQTLLKLVPAIYLGTNLDSDRERQVAINMFEAGIEMIRNTMDNK